MNRDETTERWVLFSIAFLHFLFYFLLDERLLSKLYFKYTDLIYIEQPLNNLIHGQGLLTTAHGTFTHLFGDHAYVTHILFSLPVYFIFRSSLSLFALGALHVSAAIIFLFYFAKREFDDPNPAWLIVFLFMASPYIQAQAGSLWFYGFHPDVFYLPYFFMLLYFWNTNLKTALLSFVLALLTKETNAVPLFMTMVYLSWKHPHQKKAALIFMALCIFYFLFATKIFMPMMGGGATNYHYGFSTQTILSIDWKEFLSAFFLHWLYQLRNFYFIPLLSPQTVLLAIPTSIINILAHFIDGYTIPSNPYGWNSLPVHCFLVLSLILGLKRILKSKLFRYPYVFRGGFICLCVYMLLLQNGSLIRRAIATRANNSLVSELSHCRDLLTYENSVSVEYDWGSMFMQQRALFDYPVGLGKSDFILVSPMRKKDLGLAGKQAQIIYETDRVVLYKSKPSAI